jgi:hypothetical protein
MVVQVYNPTHMRGRNWRTMVQDQSWVKVRPYPQKMAGGMALRREGYKERV